MTVESSVTVIITTIRRPLLVLRAVTSVLNQTYDDFELLVLIDGPDEATRDALAGISSPRLRVIELPENVGIARVRNRGIAHAKGNWVAFLDDDDEWFPRKLELQVAAAKRLGGERILLAGQYIEKGATLERLLPYRVPDPGEALSEYLFCRKGLLSRSGTVQTSTYFVSRRLAEAVPFRAEVRPQEDLDWLMRCAREADRPFFVVPEPLSIYHNEETTGREGAVGHFDFFWHYVHRNRSLFTPRSFSFYLATWCAPEVTLSPNPMQRWRQVYRGMRTGEMTLRTLLFAIIYASLPLDRRRTIRHFVLACVARARGRFTISK